MGSKVFIFYFFFGPHGTSYACNGEHRLYICNRRKLMLHTQENDPAELWAEEGWEQDTQPLGYSYVLPVKFYWNSCVEGRVCESKGESHCSRQNYRNLNPYTITHAPCANQLRLGNGSYGRRHLLPLFTSEPHELPGLSLRGSELIWETQPDEGWWASLFQVQPLIHNKS